MKRSKDPYEKRFWGVGCIGVPRDHSAREYNAWYSMLSRCYNPNNQSYKSYGAKGVHVCDRWLCLEYFLEDIENLPNYKKFIKEKGGYQLDKDLKQINKLSKDVVYSPETCQFIPRIQNFKLRSLHKESVDDCSSQYYGIAKTRTGNYTACMYKDSKRYYLGTYDDEIAAATVFNYVEKQCSYFPKLNIGLPKMDVNDAFSHLVSKMYPTFPPEFNTDGIIINIDTKNPYFGVNENNGKFYASYGINGVPKRVGVYDDPIAAANAHNYYTSHFNPNGFINDVPYMTPSEWLSHKITSKNNVQMCTLVKINMCHTI